MTWNEKYATISHRSEKKNVFGISGFNLTCFKTQNNNVYSEFRLKKACSETQKPKLKYLCINVKTPSKSRHRANTALYNNECCLHTSDCTSTKHYKERTQDLWEHQIHFCSVCLWTVNCDKRKKILHFFFFIWDQCFKRTAMKMTCLATFLLAS